jgi:MFS family permease
VGILALIIAVMMRIWIHDAPPGSRKPAPAESAGTMFRSMIPGIIEILKDKSYWLLCVWCFCVFSLHNSFGGLWGGPYLMHVHQLDTIEAGSILNMMGLGVLAGGIITGWSAESVLKSYKRVMLVSSVALPVFFALLAACGEYFPLWALYLWFFFLAFFGMGSLALGFAMARRLYGASRAATAAGLLNTLPSLGVFLFQPLTGYILDHFHDPGTAIFSADAYAMACVPFILLGIAGIACTALLREPA